MFFIFILFIYLVVPGLSCSTQDLLVAACELLVAACMRDLVPHPGIEPGPLHWEHRSLPIGPPGKSLTKNFLRQFHIVNFSSNPVVLRL